MLAVFFVSVVSITVTVGQFSLAAFPAQARNTVEGRVTNSGNRPLSNIRIFLQDDGYSQVATAYSDASGHFRFSNLSTGTYYVQVEPMESDYERQSQRVDVRPFNERRGGGGEVFRVDIVLLPRKGASNTSSIERAKGVLFYQQVPEAARKEFDRGVKSLGNDSFENAAKSLTRAIEIFSEYYDAIELLGTEYVKRRDYQSALPLLSHAVEINKDGWRGFYSLGIAQYESNQRGEGIRSLRRAVELNADSPNTNMWLGIALARNNEDSVAAIQALEKAKREVPEAYLYLGALYGKNRQYRQAADAYESFLRAAPHAAERDKIKKLIEEYRQKAKTQSQ